MKKKLKNILLRVSSGRLSPLFSLAYRSLIHLELAFFRMKWFLTGKRKPTPDDQKLICDNVTFIFKSFERQKLAKRLYKNIQSYYPGVKVIIADDSSKPLDLRDKYLEVLQLSFNQGLSYGLNRALERVDTPFVIRMDDDELLTPFTRWHEQLRFLMKHPEIDMVGVLPYNLPILSPLEKAAKEYYAQSMRGAVKPLIIPHMTKIDEGHIVVGKTANIFLVRTDRMKKVGYDDHIRMIDHNEFFFRAAGELVCVLAPDSYVIHYHDRFDQYYHQFRSDVEGDRRYILWKTRAALAAAQKQ